MLWGKNCSSKLAKNLIEVLLLPEMSRDERKSKIWTNLPCLHILCVCCCCCFVVAADFSLFCAYLGIFITYFEHTNADKCTFQFCRSPAQGLSSSIESIPVLLCSNSFAATNHCQSTHSSVLVWGPLNPPWSGGSRGLQLQALWPVDLMGQDVNQQGRCSPLHCSSSKQPLGF